MKKNNIINIILLAIWMSFIFYNSADSGIVSNNRSKEIANTIRAGKDIIQGNEIGKKSTASSSKFQEYNYFVRKNAHAFEYLVLAIILANLLASFRIKGNNFIIYIMFICLFYAVLDEFHQVFVPKRTSSVEDILIDFTGALIGIITYFSLVKIKSKVLKKL